MHIKKKPEEKKRLNCSRTYNKIVLVKLIFSINVLRFLIGYTWCNKFYQPMGNDVRRNRKTCLDHTKRNCLNWFKCQRGENFIRFRERFELRKEITFSVTLWIFSNYREIFELRGFELERKSKLYIHTGSSQNAQSPLERKHDPQSLFNTHRLLTDVKDEIWIEMMMKKIVFKGWFFARVEILSQILNSWSLIYTHQIVSVKQNC